MSNKKYSKKKYSKKKSRRKGLSLRRNKRFIGSFTIIFSFIIMVSATLAWSSYSEWVDNHVQSRAEDITVRITEKFEQNSVLSYEKETEKSVKVKNLSDRNTIVRVKFSESLLPFEMNMTDGEGKGNANLTHIKRDKQDIINRNNLDTWQKGNLMDSGITKDGDTLYYLATDPVLKNIKYTGEDDRKNNSRPLQLSYFEWKFNSELFELPQLSITTPYWVFDGEYFYYSEVLEGGQTTKIDLLQSIKLSNISVPNKFKNALYDIGIQAEGVKATKTGLDSWEKDQDYLLMYQRDPNFN